MKSGIVFLFVVAILLYARSSTGEMKVDLPKSLDLQPIIERHKSCTNLIYNYDLHTVSLSTSNDQNVPTLQATNFDKILSMWTRQGYVEYRARFGGLSSCILIVAVITSSDQQDLDSSSADVRKIVTANFAHVPSNILRRVYRIAVILSVARNKDLEDEILTLFSVKSPVFNKQLPEVYWFTLALSQNTSSYALSSGWTDCWVCVVSVPNLRNPINCKEESRGRNLNCYDTLLNTYHSKVNGGRNIHWTTDFFYTPSEIKGNEYVVEANPFNRDHFTSLNAAVLHFLLDHDGLNITAEDLFHRGRSHRPAVSMMTQDFFKFYDYFYTGEKTLGYILVTAHSVTRKKTSFEIYFSSFGTVVWVCWATLTLLSSILLASLLRSVFQHLANTLLEVSFWVLRTFMDQGQDFPIQSGRFQAWTKRVHRIQAFGWILGTLVLTNMYKSYLNSEMALPFPYRTKWRHIEDLPADFYKVEVATHPNCSKTLPWNQLKSLKDGNLISRSTLHSWAGTPCFYKWSHCDFFVSVKKTKAGFRVICPEEYAACKNIYKIFTQLYESTIFVCDLLLPQFVDLFEVDASSKIAFIVREDRFETTWRIFEHLMASRPELRFSHNAREKRFLAEPLTYRLPIGLDYDVHYFVPKRLHDMFSSGIYWLWAKWEKILLGYKAAGLESQRGLWSISWSRIRLADILLIFQAFLGLTVVTVVTFLIEIMLNLTNFVLPQRYFFLK